MSKPDNIRICESVTEQGNKKFVVSDNESGLKYTWITNTNTINVSDRMDNENTITSNSFGHEKSKIGKTEGLNQIYKIIREDRKN